MSFEYQVLRKKNAKLLETGSVAESFYYLLKNKLIFWFILFQKIEIQKTEDKLEKKQENYEKI